VVTRPDVISKRILQEFALFCGNQVRHLMKDERSVRALDITRAYLDGTVTKEVLVEAKEAARAAIFTAVAYEAEVAITAYVVTASSNADIASGAYAYDAANHAAHAVADTTAYYSAYPEVYDQQIDKIIELLEGEI
jgi:hypothetical protein